MSNVNVNLLFDTKRTVYAQVDYLFDARNSFPCSNIDYSDLSITLGAHTLSDTFELSIPKGNLNFDYEVEGTLADMHYNFKIEEITERNQMMTYHGRYSTDKLLYTNYRLTVSYSKQSAEPEKPSYSVQSLMQKMCSHLGLNLSFKAHNWYYPLNKLNEDDDYWYYGITGTYQNIISQLFGWLSDLPHIDFNVFIRQGTLYVIQRGFEDGNTVTIADAFFPYTSTKRKMRTEWQGSGNTQDEKTYDDENQVPFTGKIAWGDVYITYVDGYVTEEKDAEGNETEYRYIEINKQKYVSKKTIVKDDRHETQGGGQEGTLTTTTVNYDYKTLGNEVYLAKETQEIVKEVTEEGTTTITTETTVTTHIPNGTGWYYHTTKDDEGNVLNTGISQGAPGNSVSPYMVDKTQVVFNTLTQQIVQDILEGILAYLHPPLVSTNYPVADRNTIEWLIDQTDWLNNKTEERVTLDYYSTTHIVDFNDLIVWKGNTYRLESNNVRHSAEEGIRQSLTIVRWY